jgi:broad specificity polyphosphatase/5'/3'-nucleotidase SurE
MAGALGKKGTLTLHLGVVVSPYRSNSRKSRSLTTADVARILEAKYGLMAAYFRVHEKDVAGAIEQSVQGAIETLMLGGSPTDPWAAGMQTIQQGFRDFINSKEAEKVGIPGTPTKAALMGVNHRFKHPYARRNPRRPSFRDTGLFVASFRSWVD